MIILTEVERERFSAYLLQDAKSNEALMPELSKLPGCAGGAIVKKLYTEVLAAKVIISKLQATETVSTK